MNMKAHSSAGGLRRISPSVFWIVILLTGYSLWNFVALVATQAQESYDTYRYFGQVFEVQNPGFLTSALFIAIGDHQRIIYALVLISVLAWSMLAIAVLDRLYFTWVRWPLAIIILLYSMTTPVWNYNTVLLTESLTVSLFIAWFAAIVWLTSSPRSNSIWPLIGLTSTGGLAILSRPQLLIIIVPVQVVLFIWIARKNQVAKLAWATGAANVPFIAIGLFRIYQLSVVQLYQFRYALNNLVDKGSSFRPYALESMPPCEAIPTALNGPAPWNDVHALESTLINVCPDTWIWFNSPRTNFQSWVGADPISAFFDFLGAMTRVNLAVMSDGRAMPEWLSNAILSPSQPWLWILGSLILGVVAALIAKVRPRVTILSLIGFAIVAVTPFVFLFLMWASDGYDISRHLYPVLPFIGLALIIFPSTVPSRDAQINTQSGVPTP